jgi:hypothetical protein
MKILMALKRSDWLIECAIFLIRKKSSEEKIDSSRTQRDDVSNWRNAPRQIENVRLVSDDLDLKFFT